MTHTHTRTRTHVSTTIQQLQANDAGSVPYELHPEEISASP